ncbi:hypothetical protein GCM10018793_53150 [Streptomyces sulfonofaciens]|uniref:Zinc finger CGNR domain-containing protein n=1 Tax=Streptomyces sulfonofaciens TaxID=68272 RepID=A0A919GJM1_9ACTN|nr:CGNR zinc finger domain-containing protein [Streptomyces sulfonofaciens]GHH85379.1 hypothetical protein GCM10018793_53150 [Streptomyces sulfonofaciens]
MGQVEVTGELPLLGEPLPVELMNTVHLDRGGDGYDVVGDAARAGAWLDAVGHRLSPATGGHPSPGGGWGDERTGRRLRELRDALRSLAAEVTQAPPELFLVGPSSAHDEAVEIVNRLSGLGRLRPELAWPAGAEPARRFGSAAALGDRAVSLIAQEAVELFAGPQRARLRACLAPNCDRYFVKAHARREWCTSACGNRARVARHYRRHHAETRRSGGAAGGPHG